MQVGAYVRISHDLSGEAQGVTRQREDCQTLAERRGWTIRHVYEDNDLSAYQRNVTRPAFEQLLRDLRSGDLDGLIAYDLDRMWRQPRDLERVIDVFDQRPTLVFATVTAAVDLSTSEGRVMARIGAAMANKASADTGRRVARKHLDNAMKGVPVGGRRPFGWLDDKRTLHPTEAALIREAATQVTAGVGLSTVATAWRQQQMLTPRGSLMSRSALQLILSNPRLVGWRTHRGEVLHTATGEPVIGLWTPILSVDEWMALQARLGSHRRPTTTVRRYLLSGWLRCGRCHAPLRGYPRQDGVYAYTCAKKADGGCGGIAIDGAKTDLAVITLALAALAGRVTPAPEHDWPGLNELNSAEMQLAELKAGYGARRLSGETFFALVGPVEDTLRVLRRDRARFYEQQAGLSAPAVTTVEQFQALPLLRRREIITDALPVIEVLPAMRRFAPFDPERLRPV